MLELLHVSMNKYTDKYITFRISLCRIFPISTSLQQQQTFLRSRQASFLSNVFYTSRFYMSTTIPPPPPKRKISFNVYLPSVLAQTKMMLNTDRRFMMIDQELLTQTLICKVDFLEV